MESWRARKGVLASRGETDGPRVEECNAALSLWKLRTFLTREMSMSTESADVLIDQMLADRQPGGGDVISAMPTDREGGSIEAAALAQTRPAASAAQRSPSVAAPPAIDPSARTDDREA